jgi:hypothetical protein
MLNPYFSFYGETLLFHVDNKTEKYSIFLNDYGKLPSLRKISYEENLLPLIKSYNQYHEGEISNLNTNILADEFFSEQDINYILEAVREIGGIGMVRILPYKWSDFKSLGSSIIKILPLPLKDIDYEDLPLNINVEHTFRNLKREKVNKIFNKAELENDTDLKLDVLLDNEEYSHFFDMKDFFTIESFEINEIKHLIKPYTFNTFKSSNIIKDIRSMQNELNINCVTGYGMNLLITKNYILVSPLINPYTYDKNKTPIFADPYFFAGIFTLPIIEAEWPEKLNSDYVKFDLKEILKKTTNL